LHHDICHTLCHSFVYNYLNCTFSFRGLASDDLAYYFELCNKTKSVPNLAGEIFSDTYPFIENKKNFLTTNHSITVQEQFYITSWTDGDKFIPLMFVKSGSGLKNLTNMEFSMVYEPLIENYP
jgi:hypothetical protein